MKRLLVSILGWCMLVMVAQAQTLSGKEFREITMAVEGQNFRQVTLYAFTDYEQVQPGDEVKVGVLFRIFKGWNIYDNDKKSGSYLPTEVEWQLPEGCRVLKENWQTPVKLHADSDKLGYYDYCLVVATIRLGDRLEEHFKIGVQSSWQVCNEMTCVPGKGGISVDLKKGRKEKTAWNGMLKKW